MTAPSIPQMVARSLDGHGIALARLVEGKPVVREGAYASEVRGMRTVLSTLYRWECVDSDGVTQRGLDLLEALRAKGKAR